MLSDLIHHRTESPGRDPDSQPAVTEPACAPHRRIGPAADGDRDGRRRRRNDLGVADREELAVKADRLAVGKAAQDLQRFVHAASARPRVDATDFELVRILAADPHAEHEPARCEFGDAGKLARHEHRVAQRKQVKRDVARQVGVAGEQSSSVDQGVCARSDEEADVIVDADVIDSGFGDVAEQCVALPGRSGELADRGEDAHSNSSHAARLAPRSSAEFAWR